MYELLAELGGETVAVLVYALGTIAISLLGFAAEYNSLQQLLNGQGLLSVWYAYVGVIALAFAWTLGRKKLLAHLAA